MIKILFLFSILFSACGVKGPPLPPVADTPQSSETNTPSQTPKKTK